MDSSTMRRRFNRAAAVVAAAALALGGAVAFAAPAQAATAGAVTNATLSWGLSGEAGGGAFFGGCNFLSAGKAGNTGSSRVWTEADGFFQTTAGNVTVTKPDATGTQVPVAWADKCKNPSGTAVSAASTTSLTKIQVTISDGQGQVASDGSVQLAWDGDFTVAFYGGLTYWTASDPTLSLDADGNGQLTATASGYGTSMEDQTQWVPIADQQIVLADIAAGQVSDTGFTATPAYLGVEVTTTGTAQARTGANWGSFPQSYVDFQNLTGQSSYWYSSGGSRDAAKPASPISVSYSVAAAPAAPSVSVSKTEGISRAGETLTVTGSGFVPSGTATDGTRPPLAGQFSGAYVVFGKFLDAWKPSAGAASSARKVLTQKWAVPEASAATIGGANAGAITLQADGSFSAQITVSASEANDLLAGNYGIYTYGGSGTVYAPFETFTPLTFTSADDVVVEIPEWVDEATGSFGWAFAGSSPANLGVAAQEGTNFVASGSLTDIVVTDTRAGGTSPYTWSIAGQASDFTSGAQTFTAGFLGWTPKIVAGGSLVSAGAPVTSSQLGGTGLAASRALASSTAAVTATVGADLSLVLPGTTPAGQYTSTITITALSE
ncbi:hypothetical protein [Microbacterium sp. A1-JK]|uniref:hypothetical protein n=1 Tax=Microbacterium sp. A1-JK TaxID=3177516 RepID=UPI003886DD63